ncbi:hypothetical protein JYG30_10855 [Fibrella sp. USSR17]
MENLTETNLSNEQGQYSVGSLSTSTREENIHYIAFELGKTIESLASELVSKEPKKPILSVSEYIEKITSVSFFFDEHIGYEYICNSIAKDVVESDTLSYKQIGENRIIDIDKIKVNYREPLDTTANTLWEYRNLQTARSQLFLKELVEHIQPALYQDVVDGYETLFRESVEDIEVEISFFLYKIDVENWLKTEYNNRLNEYKHRAKNASILNYQWNYINPLECFSDKHLSSVCTSFVEGFTYQNPNDIDFDLRLFLPLLPRNEIVQETIDLARERKVLEWIKTKLLGNDSNYTSDSQALSSEPKKQRKQLPSTQERYARYRTDFNNYKSIEGLDLTEAIKATAVKNKASEDSIERALGLRN